MNKLTKIDEKQLSEVLAEWFNQNQVNFISNKDFWRRNEVGKTIKKQLKLINKWKNGRRGKAIKGQWTKPNPTKDDW